MQHVVNQTRSPDGAKRNPAANRVARFPDFAALHPGYMLEQNG